MKKTISVVIPTYNEEENVKPMAEAVVTMFREELPDYHYDIIFIDNDSRDQTRPRLKEICERDSQRQEFRAIQFALLWIASVNRRRSCVAVR